MPRNNPWLIIAESGRALAESARKGGYQCHIIDRFNDEDSSRFSLTQCRVNGDNEGLDVQHLIEVLGSFREIPLAGIVTGGGLESDPDWFNEFTKDWPMFANSGDVVRQCKSPERFFSLLDDAGISHPAISLEVVHFRESWLQKRIGASGGGHIVPYQSGEPLMPQHYLQQWIDGRSFSVVFIAGGRRAKLVGVSETWCRDSLKDDYRFRGAVSLGGVSRELLKPFAELVSVITEKLGLKGLCGLDTIVDSSGEIFLLEVNTRPTATFSLHENNVSLFEAHIRAFGGELMRLPEQTAFRAHEVIYNYRSGTMPRIDWPDWITDRPAAGEQLVAGQPLCTIHAESDSLAAVKKLLAGRVNRFMDQAGSMELQAA